MYFMDVAHLFTGNSLGTLASRLSHLVRYCWEHELPISKLQDDHIFDLSKKLQEEKSNRRVGERTRNNNTVRTIISEIIRFLFWYQKNFVSAVETPLIGEADVAPEIVVVRVKNPSHKSRRPEFYYTHGAMPESESTEPKGPIALPVIEAIEEAINLLSQIDLQRKGFLRRFKNNPELMLAQLDYVRSRRHFMTWIMKRVGLRPSEMVEISVKEHLGILQSKRLLIPTKKRRRELAPLRSFPITLKDATVFQRYLTARSKYRAALQRNGRTPTESDALFLGVDGSAVKKSSLERDFARLVVAAGFEDVQACLSMFRHRFITYEVIVHLKEFMDKSGKTSQIMTKTDYESILKRVSVKTGHGSVQSLWSYIDLAWEEINVWGGVERAIERLHAADRLYDEMLELVRELDLLKSSPATKKVLQDISGKLREILKSAKQEIEMRDD
jgi:hypothetical protein